MGNFHLFIKDALIFVDREQTLNNRKNISDYHYELKNVIMSCYLEMWESFYTKNKKFNFSGFKWYYFTTWKVLGNTSEVGLKL